MRTQVALLHTKQLHIYFLVAKENFKQILSQLTESKPLKEKQIEKRQISYCKIFMIFYISNFDINWFLIEMYLDWNTPDYPLLSALAQ